MTDHLTLPQPYALWLGDCRDVTKCKSGPGLIHWRPDLVRCQLGLPGHVELPGVPVVADIRAARAMGARSVVDIHNDLLPLSDDARQCFAWAMAIGMHVVGTTHRRLRSDELLRTYADSYGVDVHDVRHDQPDYPLGTGRKRSGLRLLTVAGDGIVGKKFAALAIHRRLGQPHTFCASGQTGRLICGPDDRWIVIDTVASDFATGAAEYLSPDHDDPGHWHVIEGQANPWHPAWSGCSMPLLIGSQPDALVYCVDPSRKKLLACHDRNVPDIYDDVRDMYRILSRAGFTAPTLIGVAVNKSNCTASEAKQWSRSHSWLRTIPVFDPSEQSPEFDQIVERMQAMSDHAREQS